MSSEPELPELPVLLPLTFPTPLTGPPQTDRESTPGSSPAAVTGGGLIAVIDQERGLRGVWGGGEAIAGALLLTVEGVPVGPGRSLRADSAGWERRIPLEASRSELVERGVVIDSAPAVLIFWTVDPASPGPPAGNPEEVGTPPADLLRLEVRAHRPGGTGTSESIRLEVGPGAPGRPRGIVASDVAAHAEGTGVALCPPGTAVDRARARITPPTARERQRREGRATDAGGSGSRPVLFVGDSERDALQPALTVLDGVPVGTTTEGRPQPPFLLGIEDGHPRFASDTALAEIGIAAVLSGRYDLGWAVLEALLQADRRDYPPLPAVHLAALAARWSGDPYRLHSLHRPLEPALEALAGSAEVSHTAAFPGPRKTLQSFADAIEPLGGGWHDEVVALLRSPPEGAATASGAISLPVLGREPASRPSADAEPVLPLPGAFAPVFAPAHAPRRALHAARLLRAWIEGVMGADADIAYGRLRLGPDLIRHPGSLRLVGLRAGDALVTVDCRIDGRACRLRVRQESGGLPLNVVLDLRLPFPPPIRLRVEGHPAEATGDAAPGGTSLSLQFPLDPERSIVIDRGPRDRDA
jgi:hypothetical protein